VHEDPWRDREPDPTDRDPVALVMTAGRLERRVALVTGAAKGLGAGIATRLAEEGSTVLCADVLDAGLTVEALPRGTGSPRHESIVLDVAQTAAVERVVADVLARHGRIDVLVNNAAIAHSVRPLVDIDDETVARVFAVNVGGTIACSRAVGRAMRERRSGRIINIASQVGKHAWPGHSVYSASKAAVIALTQALALELAESGVLVNCICPGTMATDQMRAGFTDTARRLGRDPEELIHEKAESMPMGRMGTPRDAGAMVAWLASDDASFSTGAVFNLTGGESVAF
jgi:NAD(P)-dependent dehydrogenase (short-subunit alcohol dehydrogenase family)